MPRSAMLVRCRRADCTEAFPGRGNELSRTRPGICMGLSPRTCGEAREGESSETTLGEGERKLNEV